MLPTWNKFKTMKGKPHEAEIGVFVILRTFPVTHLQEDPLNSVVFLENDPLLLLAHGCARAPHGCGAVQGLDARQNGCTVTAAAGFRGSRCSGPRGR